MYNHLIVSHILLKFWVTIDGGSIKVQPFLPCFNQALCSTIAAAEELLIAGYLRRNNNSNTYTSLIRYYEDKKWSVKAALLEDFREVNFKAEMSKTA